MAVSCIVNLPTFNLQRCAQTMHNAEIMLHQMLLLVYLLRTLLHFEFQKELIFELQKDRYPQFEMKWSKLARSDKSRALLLLCSKYQLFVMEKWAAPFEPPLLNINSSVPVLFSYLFYSIYSPPFLLSKIPGQVT